MDLRRYYFISQVEHALNIIFKRNHPIHSIFERSCDLGLAGITTARIANIFGWRITKRTKGKHQVVLDQMDHGHHDLRKLRAHGLIERPGNRYVYVLSDYGRKAAAMLVIVRNRILRPIAGSLFDRPPKSSLKPNSKLQAQYRRTTRSFNDLIALLKAA